MSILKSILSPFVEFKEKEKTQSSKGAPLPATETGKSTFNSDKIPPVIINNGAETPPATFTPSLSGTAIAAYQKHFEDLIDEANAKNPLFQGTDFKEFIDSKMDIEAISDEETRYRTAFNVLKRTGLTKEKLLTTGQQYINLIENDLKTFENAYAQQYKTDVEQKEQLLQKKAEESQALSEKIAALNNEIKQMSQQVIQSKDRLNAHKTSFVLAGENKKKEIQTELQKIESYFSSEKH